MTKLIFSIIFSFLFIQFSFSQTVEEENFMKYFSESQRYLLLEDSDTAIVLLNKCLDIKPNSAASFYSLSQIYFDRNDVMSSIIFAEDALRNDKNNLVYLRFLSDLYLHEFQFDLATELYEDILKISPFISDFENAINFYGIIPDYDKQLETIDLTINKFGPSFDLIHEKINIYYNNTENDNVIKTCDELITIYPDNPDSYTVYIDFLFLFQNYSKAQQLIDYGHNNFSNSAEFNYYAAELAAINNSVDEAYFHLSSVIKANQINGTDILDLMKNYDDFFAYSNFDYRLDSIVFLLTEFYNSDFFIKSFVAEYYSNHNKFYDAIDLYESVLEDNIVDFDTYIILFNLYNRFDLFIKLDSLTSIASEFFPAQPLVYLFRGISLLNTQNYDDAYETLFFGKSLVFDNPNLSAFFNFYLSQYFRLQNNDSNENLYFNNAISFASNNCDLLVYFALYYAKNQIYKEKSLNLTGECIMSDIKMLSPYIAYIYSYNLYKFEDYDSSLKYINIAISNSDYPNFVHYELLGNIYFKLSNYDLADSAWLKSVNYGNKFLNKQL